MSDADSRPESSLLQPSVRLKEDTICLIKAVKSGGRILTPANKSANTADVTLVV